MGKKLIACFLCAVLLCSVCVSAENTTDEPAAQEQMPAMRGQRPGWGEGEQPPELPEGFTPGERPQMNAGEMPPELQGETGDAGQQPDGMLGDAETPTPPQTAAETEQPSEEETTEEQTENMTLWISFGLLAAAFVFVIFYKRKQY